MLIECSKCARRHIVTDDNESQIHCPCGETLSVFLPFSYHKNNFTKPDEVKCPVCNRKYDLKKYRNNTEIVCTCGYLMILWQFKRKGKDFGRRKEDYENILLEDIPKMNKKQMDIAKVYSYFFFIKSFVPYDYTTKDPRILKFRWKIHSLGDLEEGKDKYLDHICDYIAYDKIYQDW